MATFQLSASPFEDHGMYRSVVMSLRGNDPRTTIDAKTVEELETKMLAFGQDWPGHYISVSCLTRKPRGFDKWYRESKNRRFIDHRPSALPADTATILVKVGE